MIPYFHAHRALWRSRFTAMLVPLGAVVFLGCSDDPGQDNPDAMIGGGGADAMITAECLEATEHSDLAWLQENVFSPTCATFTGCHAGGGATFGLNLSEETQTQDNLVGKPSFRKPDQTLVVPGDAAASYLMVVLGSYDGDLDPRTGTMPPSSSLLCIQKREAIERWINAL